MKIDKVLNKRFIYANLIAIAVAVVVFNTFYSVLPIYLMKGGVIDYKYVVNHEPIGYTFPSDKPDKIIAYPEYIGSNIVIEYWYHWKYDGWYHRDDWEPVILLIHDNKTVAVASRMHYMWRVMKSFDYVNGKGINGRVVVYFDYLWHTPLYRPIPGTVRLEEKPITFNPTLV